MTEPSPFGLLLRSLRVGHDLTLEALAAQSGVSVRTIGDLERGASSSPQSRTVDALADGLGLDAAERHAFLRAARARPRAALATDGPGAISPHRVFDFSGRDAEIDEALEILYGPLASDTQRPALIISGAPGIGKTTVAIEILERGRSSGHPAVFLGLDGFSSSPLSPLQVMTAMLRQLPGAEQKPPADLGEARARWRAAVETAPVTVLLDNVANEAQIRPILSICAGDVVVVTSRRSLAGLEGVRRLRLGPLRREESTAFLHRLIPQAASRDDALGEVAGLCDDIPLALRVVGNRIASRPAWTVDDLLGRLRTSEDRLRLLVAGDLAVEAAISLSYDELDPRTAALFRWISLIDGRTFGAHLAAAAVRSSDLAEVESRLDDLTDLGMLEARGGDRYRLHDLMRLFGRSKLRASVGPDEIARRGDHIRSWLLGTLERAGAWYEPQREPTALGRTGRGFVDAEAAAEWIRTEAEHWWPAYTEAAEVGEDETVCDVADALHWYSDIWMTWGNWHRFYSLAASAAQSLGDPLKEAAQLGYLAWAEIVEVGDREKAVITARTALAAALRAGDSAQKGWAQYYIGWASWTLDRLVDADAAAVAAIDEFSAAHETTGLENAQVLSSMIKGKRGQFLESIAATEATLARVRSAETTDSITSIVTQYAACLDLIDAYVAVGRFEDAIRIGELGIAIARALKDDTRVLLMMRRHIRALIHAGEGEAAIAEADEALRLLGPGSSEAFIFARVRREVSLIGMPESSGSAPDPV
ncbi:helix-turn-helix domain-containing protein [Microbacterium phyllosphaerae]|uniref:helix-turn-helix domain-containing protein n=1 Tax=Microbacterium phyllosphaerae TaxID=124798 RepID=UPI003D645B79